MFVFGDEKIFWAEVKTKSAFTWHRITECFVTGIDLHHYNDYIKIQECIGLPIWLFFYHKDGAAKDSEPGPSGLFAQELGYLMKNENHRYMHYGRHGMIYWAESKLRRLADYPLDITDDEAA